MEDKSMGTIDHSHLTQDAMKPPVLGKACQQAHHFAFALESRHHKMLLEAS